MAPGGTETAAKMRNVTLRQVVHVSLGGERLRLRISNVYGTAPLTVGAVTVAPVGPPPIAEADAGLPRRRIPSVPVDPRALRPVTFGGAASVAVPAGTE